MPIEKGSAAVKPLFKSFLSGLEVWSREGSGRGTVLVAAAMLDDALGKLIGAFLVQNDEIERLTQGFHAPLGSFSARIIAAYALGLLSKAEYEECKRIQKIRNLFAHDVHTSFSEQRVVDHCAELNLFVTQSDETRRHPRAVFEIAALGVILMLTARQEHATVRRLRYFDWPL